jgi:hypothetical protein
VVLKNKDGYDGSKSIKMTVNYFRFVLYHDLCQMDYVEYIDQMAIHCFHDQECFKLDPMFNEQAFWS